jgi:hypothetical protein
LKSFNPKKTVEWTGPVWFSRVRWDLIRHRDGELPVGFALLLGGDSQLISAKQTGTGIAQNVHLEPCLLRALHKEPAVCLAGIEEKLPLAAFATSLARFDPFRTAHRIYLSSAMSLVCCAKELQSCISIVRAAGLR